VFLKSGDEGLIRRCITSVNVEDKHPAIQAHAYGCAFVAPSLVATKIPQADVLRGVVVGVVLIPAFQALEVLALTVVWVRD